MTKANEKKTTETPEELKHAQKAAMKDCFDALNSAATIKAEINEELKHVFKRAKNMGLNTTAIRQVFAEQQKGKIKTRDEMIERHIVREAMGYEQPQLPLFATDDHGEDPLDDTDTDPKPPGDEIPPIAATAEAETNPNDQHATAG